MSGEGRLPHAAIFDRRDWAERAAPDAARVRGALRGGYLSDKEVGGRAPMEAERPSAGAAIGAGRLV